MNKTKKKCNKCNKDKQLSGFVKRNDSKDGYRNYCKACRNVKLSYWRKVNTEKIKGYNKKWQENNPDKAKETNRNSSKNFRKNNPEKVKETYDKWRSANPEYDKNKHKKNPHIKSWRNILHNSLKRLDQEKQDNTINLLGYSALDLKNHITSLFTEGMSWNNYGEWHIDHIKRIYEFNKNTPMSIVNALSNLRPLWATSRIINGVFYEGNLNRG